MHPLVSIIIPCYNAEKYVAEAIQSALDQTYPNCETIVIDDGSTDSSLEVIKSFGDKVRWETGPNRGGCAARNRGIELANGEWIQFLDADDFIAIEKIALQIEAIHESGLRRCIATCAWRAFPTSSKSFDTADQSLAMPANPVDWLIQKYSGKGTLVAHAWLASRELIQNGGGWNETLTKDQDGEFFDQLAVESERIVHVSKVLAFYRKQVAGSVSGRTDEKAFASCLHSLQQSVEKLKSTSSDPRIPGAVAYAFMRIAVEAFPRFPDVYRKANSFAHAHGGSRAVVSGGRLVKMVRRVFGWRSARLTAEFLMMMRKISSKSQ